MKLFKNRTVLGIVCIVLSLLICFGVTPLFNRAVNEKTTIVRVKSEISTGDQITEDMVEVVEVGGFNLPQNIIREAETVLGTYALADFYAGDYILSSKVSETMQAENAYLYRLDGTQQAISVSIKSFASGLSGKLESGDIVSIVAANFRGQGQTIIPPELQYVEVISATTDTGADVEQNTEPVDGEEELALPSTITVLASPEQSKILAELEADGEIHVALVYRGDEENRTQFLTMQNSILEEIYLADEDADTIQESEEDYTEDELSEDFTNRDSENLDASTSQSSFTEDSPEESEVA